MHSKLAFVATLVNLALAIPVPHFRPPLTPVPRSLPLPGPVPATPGLPPSDLFRRHHRRHSSANSGLAAITAPVIDGVANPLTTGVGHGVAGAAHGTAQTADLLGEAMAELAHVLGGVAANTVEGTGVAVANAAPAVQDTVHAVQQNHGVVGEVAHLVGGSF